MNKSRYRVIFNKKTGVFAAVSELAKRHTKSTISGNTVVEGYVRSAFFIRFSKLAVCIALLCNGINVVSAQVVAATNAPQKPIVTTTQNHVTDIQIVAPNSAGVSHNQYQHFDINQQGAILSNNVGVANTQLGGWVAPNPQLQNSGPAKVIVNEVTSTDKSVLKGYLEVAGQRADVIVSNPNGISVGNFGVINASRSVLTTGKPIFGGTGSLDAFRVNQGQISIHAGSKLNNKDISQTDLIARSVEVNGELWGKNVNVVTGANQVKYDDLGVTVIAGQGAKPQVAIDVAALGGMYANKINLVGSEAGVGVANYGEMVSNADDLRISNNGKVTIAGNTASSKDIVINAHGDVENQSNGVLRAKNDIALQANGNVKNTGLMSSDHDATINSQNINNTGRVYADTISLNAKAQVNNSKDTKSGNAAGVVAAHDRLTIGANEVNNVNDALLLTEHGALTIHGADNEKTAAAKVTNASAKIDAGGDLTVNAKVFNNINTQYQTAEQSSQQHIVEYIIDKETYSSDKAMIVDNGHYQELIYTKDPNKTIQECKAEWDAYQAKSIVERFSSYMFKGIPEPKEPERTAEFYTNDYMQTTTETILKSSKPGEVVAHGDMTLSGTVTNDKSMMTASGTIQGNLDAFNNIDGKGSVIIHNDGTSIKHSTQYVALHTKQGNKWDAPTPIADPVAKETANLVDAKKIEHDETLTKELAPEDKDKETLLNKIDSQLYHKAAPGANYLIETDPAFTNYATFMSSDYLLSALGIKGAKHLGDGYYEQKLVMDQILRLTGHRDLKKDIDDEEQYKELMDAALAVKDQLHLQTGVGLTAEQQKSLSKDIVWMVSKKITMPNGKTTEVLSPVVYLAHNDNRQQPEMNSIVSANNIAINTKNTINNSGLVTANNTLALASGKNIVNSFGDISSTNKDGKVSLLAKENIDDISAKISGADVDINADKNVSITTNLSVNQGLNATNINMDGVADISGGNVKIKSGKDIVTSAANINATNKISIEAQGNLELGATTTREEKNIHGDLGSHVNKAKEQTNGTQISSNGDIELIGKQGVTTQAANVETDGKLQVMSDKDVVIGDASQHMSTDFNDTHKDSNLLNSHYEQKTEKTSEENSEGSSLSGDSIHIVAGHDVDVAGSEVVASHDVKIDATNNLAITAGRNVYEESTSHTEKTSGLTMDGASLNLGLENDEKKEEVKQVTHNSSAIASLEGNVTLTAGQHYGQSGSSVLANTGNIKITAKDVDIVHEKDTVDSNQSSKHEKVGISAGVSSDVVSSLLGIQGAVNNYKKTDGIAQKRLAAVTASAKAYDTYKQAEKIYDNAQKINAVAQKFSQVSDLAKMASLAGIDASVSIGASKQLSKGEQHDSTVKSSSVKAGGDITIEATGAGKDSNVTIIGSDLQSGGNTHLKADNRVDILAGQNTHSSTSSNKSFGGSVGLSLQKGWNGSLSAGYGTSDGDSVNQVNSHVQSGQKINIESGGDTKIQGGVISGKQVNADIGGNLNIESLQDKDTSASKQINAGIDVSVKQGGSGNFSLSNSDSTYATVVDQSGIKAGDDGFNVKVKGNTDLKGAVVTSNEKATNSGKNHLETGTLTTSSIHNHSEANAESKGMSLDLSKGAYGVLKGIAEYEMTKGVEKSGPQDSETKSAISAGQIVINDEQKQLEKTGKNVSQTVQNLNRDTEHANVTVEKNDIETMKEKANLAHSIKDQFFLEATKHTTDEVYFADNAPKTILKGGKAVDLSEENIVADKNGHVKVYVNGIMNDLKHAIFNGYKQQVDAHVMPNDVYNIVNPKTENPVSEVLYAALDFTRAGTGLFSVLGASNGSYALKDFRDKVAEQNKNAKTHIIIDETDHSRGSLTSIITSQIQDENGDKNVPLGSVLFNGAAANAQKMSSYVNAITSGKGQVFESTHANDLVGHWIGGNTITSQGAGSNISFGEAHSSYGINADKDPEKTKTTMEVWGNPKGSTDLDAGTMIHVSPDKDLP
jgi:filamentous hemagglutinin